MQKILKSFEALHVSGNQTEFPNTYIYSENSWDAASGNLACMLTTQLSRLYYLLLYGSSGQPQKLASTWMLLLGIGNIKNNRVYVSEDFK